VKLHADASEVNIKTTQFTWSFERLLWTGAFSFTYNSRI